MPDIDKLVDATAGHELLSFVDDFLGYNQIHLHPDDKGKTAFITPTGIYCYIMMSFGLKNVGATYQRCVNKMFEEKIRDTMEVYVDDMLIKSLEREDHIAHLAQCFAILRKYQMKLNQTKFSFRVSSGRFLKYIITQRGIEVNPEQIKAIQNLQSPPPPRKEVQRLTCRIVALSRFASRLADRAHLFFKKLKKTCNFFVKYHVILFNKTLFYMKYIIHNAARRNTYFIYGFAIKFYFADFGSLYFYLANKSYFLFSMIKSVYFNMYVVLRVEFLGFYIFSRLCRSYIGLSHYVYPTNYMISQKIFSILRLSLTMQKSEPTNFRRL